ncbi:MAG: helix-turn-helix domain-containing protein [Actinomycetota bacterium]|nr:helix-turn-helix domain-containing protein [Actinomycetota bacterium]
MGTWAGDLIRIARQETRLSQRELARRAGTSQAAIVSYETGKRSPSLETLARIVRAAGLDLRIQIAPADSHDEWLALYERSLPPDVVEASRRKDRELVAAARAERRASR